MTKTVTVRIAVAVDPTGDWASAGYRDGTDLMGDACECIQDGEARYWLTAELTVPDSAEIVASVEPRP